MDLQTYIRSRRQYLRLLLFSQYPAPAAVSKGPAQSLHRIKDQTGTSIE